MKTRFDLEQEIMKCWSIVDDIEMLAEYFLDSPKFKDMPPEYADKVHNKLTGLSELYSIRFERLWSTFENCVKSGEI